MLASSRPGHLAGHDIWMFTRSSPSQPWQMSVNLPQVNSTSTDYCVTVTEDHLEMYLSSASKLVRSTRVSATQPWGTAQFNIPPLLALVGIDFHTAAVTYDAKGVNSITNGLKFSIHR
jgi:hypothetical protein